MGSVVPPVRSGATAPLIFLATVPSAGAVVYDVRPSATTSALSTGLSVSTSQIQNSRYLVQLNANGDVISDSGDEPAPEENP